MGAGCGRSSLCQGGSTFAEVEVVAGDALEANAPNGFAAAVVAAHVFVAHILINVVGQFEEARSILWVDALLAEVEVGSAFALVPLAA